MSQYSRPAYLRRVIRASQFVLVLCAILFAGRAATALVIVDLDTLPGGTTTSQAFAVNANGQVVRFSTIPDGTQHGFSWT
jgi:hypothetical protein